jgi:ABC-type multidrug transport system fused ATPase/permease subunit
MRVVIKQVTFIEEGRIIIDGIEYKSLSSDAVLSDIQVVLSNYSKVGKGFKENMKYGEYDSWSGNYDNIAENGWRQCANWILKMLQKNQADI